MLRRMSFLMVLLGVILPAFADQNAESDPRWLQAREHMEAGRYQAAEAVLRHLREDFPGSQRAAYQLGRCERRLGNHWEAATVFGEAYEADPQSYWAEPALYYRAVACRDGDCAEVSREAIETLFAYYPDSSWTARAALLEVELNGGASDSADTALTIELEAGAAFDGAMHPRERSTPGVQIEQVLSVIDNYPNTATALRARKTLAHLQIRQGQKDAAIETIESLLSDVKESAPQSRIVEESRERLAGLYHAQGRKAEALAEFDALAESARNKKIKANAKLQASGLDFEILQKRRWASEEITSEEWNRVRERCEGVLADGSADSSQKARAELMVLETFLWESNPEECLTRAEAYIASHAYPDYRRELATAHLFAGESLLRLGKAEQALGHLQWIESELEKEGEVWPWDYLVARTYYRIYDAKLRQGDPEGDARSYADYVLREYPDTTCARLLGRSESAQ